MAQKIRKGDIVYVITGDFKGTKGKVLQVDPKQGRVFVEGVNVRQSKVKPSIKNPDGGKISKEYSIHCSNVALATPSMKEDLVWKAEMVTRVGFRINESGKKERFAKRTSEEVSYAS